MSQRVDTTQFFCFFFFFILSILCGKKAVFQISVIVICLHEGFHYSHEPPKVKCETQVYHSNIDQEGNVCLNILREDWNPFLTINSIVYGLEYLFLKLNLDNPLKEAAKVLTAGDYLSSILKTCTTEFIDLDDLLLFKLVFYIDEGFYKTCF